MTKFEDRIISLAIYKKSKEQTRNQNLCFVFLYVILSRKFIPARNFKLSKHACLCFFTKKRCGLLLLKEEKKKSEE
jgi:hypothetical protein